jgi:hypothetical protein
MAMTTEQKAARAAARKEEARYAALRPIADRVGVLEGDTVNVRVDHVFLEGNIKDVNVVLEKMGYRPVRITFNMLNRDAKRFCVDINCPVYLDPGCDSYWSA